MRKPAVALFVKIGRDSSLLIYHRNIVAEEEKRRKLQKRRKEKFEMRKRGTAE
jgi:hypothetical protein